MGSLPAPDRGPGPGRPRVLHVITGLNSGGAEAVLFRLVTGSPDIDHGVVSLSEGGVYAARLREAGVPVESLGLGGPLSVVRGMFRLVRRVRRSRPDVIQTYMYHADLFGGIAGRLGGCRRVVWGIHNSTLPRGSTKLRTRAIMRVCAVLSRFLPEQVISCARSAVRVHEALGYRPRRWTVVGNGCDTDLYRPDPAARDALREQLGLTRSEVVLSCIARFAIQKDHQNLFAALSLIGADVRPRVALAGTGMERDNDDLRALIERFGVGESLVLLGERDDVPTIMAMSDANVLPSAFGEAFPNVLVEAMLCGVPCIATDVGDASEIIGDTGWVVPPHDADSLAGAVTAAASEASSGRSAGSERRERCRRRAVDLFSLERMISGYREVWRLEPPGRP